MPTVIQKSPKECKSIKLGTVVKLKKKKRKIIKSLYEKTESER